MSLIPVRVVTSPFFAEMAAGAVLLLLLLSFEILLTVVGFVHSQDINISNYFEFTLEQYKSEGENPKPLDEVWMQFEAVRQIDREEERRQELQLQREMSMVKWARVPCWELAETGRGKHRVV
jgi:hypothetical protein